MQPGDLLFSLLTQHPAVAALVGTRVYPVRVPQGKPLPAVAYQQIGGTSKPCDSYGRYRYQLSCFADTYTSVVQLSSAVEQALSGYEQGDIYIEADAAALDQFAENADKAFRTQDFFIELPTSSPA